MKKLASLVLGLSLVLGTTAFAEDKKATDPNAPPKEKKAKKSKKSTTTTPADSTAAPAKK
jgi:hypothetical protein